MNFFLNNGGGGFDPFILVVIIAGLGLVAMLILPNIFRRKRQNAIQEMHNNIGKGDVVKTACGIIGTVVDVEVISPVDRVVVIESGCPGSMSTLRIDAAGVWGVIAKAGTLDSQAATGIETTAAMDATLGMTSASAEIPTLETPTEGETAATATESVLSVQETVSELEEESSYKPRTRRYTPKSTTRTTTAARGTKKNDE